MPQLHFLTVLKLLFKKVFKILELFDVKLICNGATETKRKIGGFVQRGRKGGVEGKRVVGRVDVGGGRDSAKKHTKGDENEKGTNSRATMIETNQTASLHT